jgi:hypothetical protein
MRRAPILFAALAVVLVGAHAGWAQTLPSGPLELANGQVTVAAEVAATFGEEDKAVPPDCPPGCAGFFNYTDYQHNALRMFRVSFTGAWRPSRRFAFLTEIRSEDTEQFRPYALYFRVRPWPTRAFDVQVGRIPPVFGAYSRHVYGTDNSLIGQPLAYQYLTSLRPDAIPENADELLLMRGRGWRPSYSVSAGSPPQATGVPIISAYQWDVGIEANLDTRQFEAAAAVTSGTLSNPRVDDDNDGRQFSARVGWKPVVGLVIGASYAHGEWLNGALRNKQASVIPPGENFPQEAFGVDLEYSRDYWLVRGEMILSRWRLPKLGTPFIDGPLDATSGFVETRYRFTPRFFAAARVDGLTFSKITGSNIIGVTPFDGLPHSWDAPVSRIEVGGGVYLQRNLIARAVVQRNWRDGGLVHDKTYVSGQLAFWF